MSNYGGPAIAFGTPGEPRDKASVAGHAFRVPLEGLRSDALLHVRIAGGPALAGSPVRIATEAAACRAAVARGTDRWRPFPVTLAAVLAAPARDIPAPAPVDVFIPLEGTAEAFASYLASLATDLPPEARVMAVQTGRAGAALRRLANAAASDGRLALRRAWTPDPGRDVLLLSGATLLPPGAVARLAAAAYDDAATGTATPMTTDGGPTTRGRPGTAETQPSTAELNRLDAALRTANAGLRVALPAAPGLCTFIRHDCLREAGAPRDATFANTADAVANFALRAAHLGWRHVVACDVLAAAAGHATGGLAAPDDGALLERLHPGQRAALAAWSAGDPLRGARRAMDTALWAQGRRRCATVLVTHNSGGGVERRVAARAAALRAEGQRAIVVRPGDGFAVSDGVGASHPNLRFETVEALAGQLRDDRPVLTELHHVAAHDPEIARLPGLLRTPFDVIVHDYAAICPRVTLLDGRARFCGEPADRRDCEDCVADHGARIPLDRSVAAHRDRQAMLLRMACRVVTPSRDAADRMRRFVPRIDPVVTPWEDDAVLARDVRRPAPRDPTGEPVQVAVVGGIGPDKGFDVLLACARDAARRDLALRFIVVGHTTDDERLLATGRAFVTGPFVEGEAPALLRGFAPDLGFLPSVWPETWCYALSALWQAGLYVMAFDLGAQGERIAATGAGRLLPCGTPAGRLNDLMFDLAHGRSTTPVMRPAGDDPAGGRRRAHG